MDFVTHIPFVEFLGMQLIRFEPGEVEILLPMRPELTNSLGVMHGGATMTLLDVAMAHAARSDMPRAEMLQGVVTIEMKTSFMRPGRGDLRAIGKLMHRTRSMSFCEARIVDADGDTLTHATGTFKLVQRPDSAPAAALSSD